MREVRDAVRSIRENLGPILNEVMRLLANVEELHDELQQHVDDDDGGAAESAQAPVPLA